MNVFPALQIDEPAKTPNTHRLRKRALSGDLDPP